MSHEHEVFADALMELGFEEVEDGFRILPYRGFDRIFGEDRTGQPGADRGSTIEVKLYADHVNLEWVTSWVRPRDGYPLFSYPFPEQWDYALLRLRQFVRLAEHKELTGEALYVASDRVVGAGVRRRR